MLAESLWLLKGREFILKQNDTCCITMFPLIQALNFIKGQTDRCLAGKSLIVSYAHFIMRSDIVQVHLRGDQRGGRDTVYACVCACIHAKACVSGSSDLQYLMMWPVITNISNIRYLRYFAHRYIVSCDHSQKVVGPVLILDPSWMDECSCSPWFFLGSLQILHFPFTIQSQRF